MRGEELLKNVKGGDFEYCERLMLGDENLNNVRGEDFE